MRGVTNSQRYFSTDNGRYPIMSSMLSKKRSAPAKRKCRLQEVVEGTCEKLTVNPSNNTRLDTSNDQDAGSTGAEVIDQREEMNPPLEKNRALRKQVNVNFTLKYSLLE